MSNDFFFHRQSYPVQYNTEENAIKINGNSPSNANMILQILAMEGFKPGRSLPDPLINTPPAMDQTGAANIPLDETRMFCTYAYDT